MNRPRSGEGIAAVVSIGMRPMLIVASVAGLTAALLLSAGDARA